MNQVSGSRSKDFQNDNTMGGCVKIIDGSSGTETKVKFKERFEGRC